MGKRKERRQIAMNAVGRRVKLDLLTEPSGDLVGSSQDGVRGEIDSNNHAELPNSPSSSGHQLENPLMLLEQYSDDELAAHDEQGKASFIEEKKDDKGFIGSAPVKDKDEEKDSASEHILQIAEKCEHKESNVVYPVESLKENNETRESTTLDGVISGWKVLLHEESNQYYYWNVSTGETSWEVPSILIPMIDIGNDEKATYDIDVDDANFRTSEYHANLNTQLKDYNPGQTCDVSNDTHEFKMDNEEYKFKALHGKGVDGDADLKDMKNMAGQHESNMGISFIASDSFKDSGDSLSNCLSKPGEDAEKLGDVPSAEEIEVQVDFSSNLVEHCKSLLHRLKAMQWSQKCLQGHDQISKYMVEVDIRLADIMSLACNGFSLLPFWVHSEKRLKLLEASIDEIPVLSNSLQSCDADHLHTSHHETTDETKLHANGNISIHHSCREVYAAEYAGSLESRKDASAEALNGVATNNSGENALEEGEVVEHAAHEELSPETVHLGEEVDMELDMEVEDVPVDSSIVDTSFGQNCIDHGKDMVQALPSNEQPSFLEQASIVPPPPPDEDWVPPPPPPDDEPFPPPPPDEPPEAAYSQPSDLQSVQHFPCTVSYPVSGYGFYGQMDNGPSTSNLYSHAEGQVAVSHQHLYYEAVANAYSSNPMEANTVDPHAYYGFQGGSEQHMPVAVTADSSVHPSASISEALSEPTASYRTNIQVSPVFSLQNKCDGVVDVTPAGVSVNFPTAQATFEKSNTVIASDNLLASSTFSITASATSVASASNVPLKVSRNKKRTVSIGSTLRLNKKVSNLVDKWKAAKEELDEVEEEPASAYEILEKKRHREIEEWHAKLIASGEAKDNANFQPLGGDWRERVRQKRAEKLIEAEAEPMATATDGAGESHQFDLNALSIGLPSGWKVYFDESSKQVYYGNITTLETTWSRPIN